MKKKKKTLRKQKRKSSESKISAMLIEYASDYINLGDNLEEKQSYLNGACTAWNIALLKKEERKKALESFIEEYKATNPGIDDADNVLHDMELLIKEKLRLYPDVKKIIKEARIMDDKGKNRIVVTSISYQAQDDRDRNKQD
jgi:hypothetical protein